MVNEASVRRTVNVKHHVLTKVRYDISRERRKYSRALVLRNGSIAMLI
jgi:hypothetical protein